MFDDEADRKIRDASLNGTFNWFSTSDRPTAHNDRRHYMIFVLRRYFMVRGRKEVTFLKWSQIRFFERTVDDKILHYIKLIHQ